MIEMKVFSNMNLLGTNYLDNKKIYQLNMLVLVCAWRLRAFRCLSKYLSDNFWLKYCSLHLQPRERYSQEKKKILLHSDFS